MTRNINSSCYVKIIERSGIGVKIGTCKLLAPYFKPDYKWLCDNQIVLQCLINPSIWWFYLRIANTTL